MSMSYESARLNCGEGEEMIFSYSGLVGIELPSAVGEGLIAINRTNRPGYYGNKLVVSLRFT